MQATAKWSWCLAVLTRCAVCIPAIDASPASAKEASSSATTGRTLPKYQLAVGQELVYRQTRQQDFGPDGEEQSDAASDRMEWRVVVVDKNDDGSWRLFIRSKIEFVNDDGRVRAQRHSLGYCDLRPNGSYALDEQTAVVKRLIPYELFCRLPDDQYALRKGWEFDAPVVNYGYRLSAEDVPGQDFRISSVETSTYSQVHGWEQTRFYDFDVHRGLVTSITSEFKDSDREQVRSRRVVELSSVTTLDQQWVGEFRREAGRYLDDFRDWLALCYEGRRSHTVDECRQARAEARAVLQAGREHATLEIVQESYDMELEQHDADQRSELELAERRSQFFAMAPQFATDWQAETMDGASFRLDDLRGRPVVLFVWGTNCEYCVMMGPQLNQLSAEFKEEGVVVLGMFVRREGVPPDKEDGQAAYLIDHAFPGFGHLEGTEIEKLYQLRELGMGHPSLVVLDPAGRPCELQLGYSPDIVQRGRAVLGELLNVPAIQR